MSVTNDGIVTNVWDFSEADGVWDSYLSYSGVVVGVWGLPCWLLLVKWLVSETPMWVTMV